jgi:hypothetical protein
MALNEQTNNDFKRALRKALWRRVASWLTKESNELVPFYEIRQRIPIKGQSYLGLQTVPMEKIVGSTGRYRDFDRAFLPKQTRTRARWISIDKAHYNQITLPPVELYKIGEAYFVKDGNHRVSVAREQGQIEIEATVIEIRVPVPITPDIKLKDLDRKQEYAQFLEKTQLHAVRPDAEIELTISGEYARLLEHINVHRWFLGEEKESYIPFTEAVASWFDNVYRPLVTVIEELDLVNEFPGRTPADLFLWTNEYQWYRRDAYQGLFSVKQAEAIFAEEHVGWPARKLTRVLKDAPWLDRIILEQERASFLERTGMNELLPETMIRPTLPGQYVRILEHIDVHRWYLGEERGGDISYEEALRSWHANVYLPIVEIIRENDILEDFPGRSEADLYLWILENRELLMDEAKGKEKEF